MTATTASLSMEAATDLSCAVRGCAGLAITMGNVGDLRSQLRLPNGSVVPSALTKHSDEQTVTALAAVLQAIAAGNLGDVDLRNWGVLAAPRFMGRQAFAHTLQRYATEGAWGISPHVIPHRLLHSVSGTISLALQIHGPNFGIDGVPESSGQFLVTAMTMLDAGQVPGVLAVMTGWDPEPIPERPGSAANPAKNQASICRAVALALTPATPNGNGAHLRLTPNGNHPAARSNGRVSGTPAPFNLQSLLDFVAASPFPLAPMRWRLGWGGVLEWHASKESPKA